MKKEMIDMERMKVQSSGIHMDERKEMYWNHVEHQVQILVYRPMRLSLISRYQAQDLFSDMPSKIQLTNKNIRS